MLKTTQKWICKSLIFNNFISYVGKGLADGRVVTVFLILSIVFPISINATTKRPRDIVELATVEPSIVQEIRYAGSHNFIGRPITGYHQNSVCVLTNEAAQALKQVQKELLRAQLSLKVYDCYRPQRAVSDFVRWSHDDSHHEMKSEFYPRVAKSQLFPRGYVAEYSGHSRGSTVDLTIVQVDHMEQPEFHRDTPLVACFAQVGERFADNSIDMGTGYDCMDELAHPNAKGIGKIARANRQLLSRLMHRYGFAAYDKEWWHFTLRHEPYPHQFFDFSL